jgi:hypothetical protein
MNMLFRFLLIAGGVVITATGLGGCGGAKDSRPERAAVSGKVLRMGQPVAGATVIFEPAGSTPAASGETDASGRFQLTTFDKHDGAVPGEYKVAVQKVQVNRGNRPANAPDDAAAPPPEEKWLLPVKYGSGESSGLAASVKSEGANDFAFELPD